MSLVSQKVFRSLGNWDLKEVIALKKRFEAHKGHFGLTRSEFAGLLSFKQPAVNDVDGLFAILDHDHNGRIDGLEFLSSIAICCDGNQKDKIRFCFELCDFNINGSLSAAELTLMMRCTISGLLKLFGHLREPPQDDVFVDVATRCFRDVDGNRDDKVTMEEFYQWYLDNSAVFERINSFMVRADEAARDVDSDDSASELDESGDEDIAMETGHEDRTQAQEAANADAPFDLEDAFANGPVEGDEFMAVKPWLGAIKEPTTWREPRGAAEAPEASLELEWVHGYRGQDCRNNIAILPNGNLAYTAAGLGVVLDVGEWHQRFYDGHTDDVISFAQAPRSPILATGQLGRTPTIHVWNGETMENLAVLEGFHKRGVSLLAFSPDGSKLASIGLDNDHSIAIYDWRKGKLVASSKGDPGKLLGLAWHPEDGSLVVCGVKVVKFFTIHGRSMKAKKGLLGRKGKIQTMLSVGFANGDAIVGTASGHIYRFSGRKLAQVIPAHESKCPVSVIVMETGGGCPISGGKDGQVKVWSSELKPAKTHSIASPEHGLLDSAVRAIALDNDKLYIGTRGCEIICLDKTTNESTVIVRGHYKGELWGLHPDPLRACAYTCGDDATLRAWDLMTKRMRSHVPLPDKARAIAVSPNGHHVAVGLWSGAVAVFDAATWDRVASFQHAREWVEDLKYNPDGSMLAVTSHDNHIYLYAVRGRRYAKVGVCRGHSSYITHVDFSADGRYLQTNCGAYELLFWTAEGEQVRSASSLRDVQWHSWTCVLGWPVQGVWPPGADGTDINAVDRSHSGSLLATADDFGRVNLFKYPCVRPGAASHSFRGHSSHVTNTRFSHDDRRLLTTGGNDLCLFQWKVRREGDDEAEEAKESLPDDLFGHHATVGRAVGAYNPGQLLGGGEGKETDAWGADDPWADGPVEGDEFMAVKPWLGSLVPMQHYENKLTRLKGDEPDASLELEWVHGYRGWDCRNNIRYTKTGEIVTHAAAVGVVQSVHERKQRFHSRHTDDVLSLALHPDGLMVATGEVGRKPKTMVWDAQSLDTVAVLDGFHRRGVTLLAFDSRDMLVTVGLDNDHSVAVYNWRQSRLVATAKGSQSKVLGLATDPTSEQNGAPLRAVTCGEKHVKFWELQGSTFKSHKGIFGKHSSRCTMVSAAYARDFAVTGGLDGTICLWRGHNLFKVVRAHQGPVYALFADGASLLSGGHDGKVQEWDVDEMSQPSGGRDKRGRRVKVRAEDDAAPAGLVTSLDAPAGLFDAPVRSVSLRERSGGAGDRVRAPGGERTALVGTRGGEVYEWTWGEGRREASMVTWSHSGGELWGLAPTPDPLEFVTAGEDGTLRVWSTRSRAMVASADVHVDVGRHLGAIDAATASSGSPQEALRVVRRKVVGTRATAVSNDGRFAAVALTSGVVALYAIGSSSVRHGEDDDGVASRDGPHSRGASNDDTSEGVDGAAASRPGSGRLVLVDVIHEGHAKLGKRTVPQEWIQDMKFKPVGSSGGPAVLAVGSHDNAIYMYTLAEGGAVDGCNVLRKMGHSSYITHFDFSQDGRYLQSNCGAYEHLFWQDTGSGWERLMRGRDTLAQERWESWTCVLGWPVQGIWPAGADGTDINAVDRSRFSVKGPGYSDRSDGNAPMYTLVTGDDFGQVNLFKYPCLTKGARCATFRGHSSHVTNVRFTADDRYVISVGGNDRCIMQWRAHDIHAEGGEGDDAATERSDKTTASMKRELDEVVKTEFEIDESSFAFMDAPEGDEFMAVKPWLGAVKEPTNFRHEPGMDDAPDANLELEWVHGYRGWDCRNNLAVDADDNIVYHTAAVGVVQDVAAHRQRFHFGHKDDIVGFAMHPEGHIVATGEVGRRPRIILWDAHSGNSIRVLQGFHRRAVRLLAFSRDGQFLVTVGDDDDHSVALYRTQDGAPLATCKGDKNKVLDVEFAPDAGTIVTVGVRHVRFWTVSGRAISSKKGLVGRKGDPKVAKCCVAFLRGDAVTGQADGTIYRWSGRKVADIRKAHRGAVRALATVDSGSKFLSGGAEGKVFLWDAYFHQSLVIDLAGNPIPSMGASVSAICASKNRLIVGTRGGEVYDLRVGDDWSLAQRGGQIDPEAVERVVESHYKGELWGLAPTHRGRTFVTAGDDGTVRMWDLAARRMAASIKVGDVKARAVAVSPGLGHVAVGLSTGRVTVFSPGLDERMADLKLGRGKEAVSVMRYSSEGSTLAVGSHDDRIYLLNTAPYVVRAVCRGHSSYITHLDFSMDGRFLQTNCGAYELLFWSVGDGAQVTSASSLRDTRWATWTCTLGFPVQGIWPAEADGTDVNAVDRSHSGKLLATSEDSGLVKLFRYPCVSPASEFRASAGHSSHVTNVAFMEGDTHVISTGGNDKSVFQWAVRSGK